MNLVISSMLLLAAATFTTTPAARPASCASGLGQSGHDAGYDAQTKVLDQLWRDHHESCDEFNSFKNDVEIALTRDPPANVFLRCRRAGMLQAFDDAVSRIALTCSSTCAFDLDPYTALTAKIFCNGTTAAGFAQALRKEGVAKPNCGRDDWTKCKEKVKIEAEAVCPARVTASRNELDQLVAAACL